MSAKSTRNCVLGSSPPNAAAGCLLERGGLPVGFHALFPLILPCGSARPARPSTPGPARTQDTSEERPPRLGLLAAMASTLKKAKDPAEGAAIDGLARKLAGREFFLDPRIFNYPALRDACIPAANGHFNAKALAVLYDNFLASLGLSGNGSRSTGHVDDRRDRRNEPPPPLLRRARVNEMRAYQVCVGESGGGGSRKAYSCKCATGGRGGYRVGWERMSSVRSDFVSDGVLSQIEQLFHVDDCYSVYVTPSICFESGGRPRGAERHATRAVRR